MNTNIPQDGHKWKTAELKQILEFPVVGYKKENGFLGLISKYNGKIRFFTKSSDSGDYVNWFIGALCDNYNIYIEDYKELHYTNLYNECVRLSLDKKENKQKVLESYEKNLFNLKLALTSQLYNLIEEGYTYIFECIDPQNDPHIIKYDKPQVVLLDVVENTIEKENFKSYEELEKISKILCTPLKKKILEFNTWEEFEKWKDEFTTGATQWDCKHEGFVLVDKNGFRVKYKSTFYTFWKCMRGLKERLQKGAENRKIYKTKEEIQIVKLMESTPKDELKEMSIIDVEDKFYTSYGG